MRKGALAGSPLAILADPPTANLDPRLVVRVLERFGDLARSEERAL